MYPNGYSEAGAMPPPSAQQRSTTYQPPMHSGSSGPFLHSPTNAQFYGQPLPQQAMSVDSTMSTPQSATHTTIEPSIDTKRVQLLLELNNALIQEVMQLQANGRAGSATKQGSDAQAASPTTPETTEGDSEKKGDESAKKGPAPSREYMECMFRLRHNFAYLTNLASRNPQKQQPIVERPQILEPISANIEGNTISEESMNSIRDMYRRLKELFPPTSQVQQPQVQAQPQGQAQVPPHLAGVSQLQQQPHQRRMDQMQAAQSHAQAQQMQQQMIQRQQQMASISPGGMTPRELMDQQLYQQNIMARNMAMQNQRAGMGPGMQ